MRKTINNGCGNTGRFRRIDFFTLIECLVVIAIISILASILLPALNRARDRAKSVLCNGNLKQTGAAALMYASEYGGNLPHLSGSNYGVDVMTEIARVMDPNASPMVVKSGIRIDNFAPFSCPSRPSTSWSVQTSYGVNSLTCQLDYDPNLESTTWKGNIFKTKNPSSVFLVMDFPKPDLSCWWQFRKLKSYILGATDPEYWAESLTRHNGSVNMVFADGHTGANKLSLEDEETLRPYSGYDQ
jgi:prepilin-type N-terminal cleavage/methylation domain-containing protein/prepilin-type processing-associated H-X9-DG protein